jgi:L-asparaginase II
VSGMDEDGRAAIRGTGQSRRRLMVRAALAALVVLALSSSAADWWQSYPLG